MNEAPNQRNLANYKKTEEWKKKIGIGNLGKKRTEEMKEKLRTIKMGRDTRKDKYRNRAWLLDQYWKLNRSSTSISKLCGVSKHIILCWMKRLNIPSRTGSQAKIGKNNPMYGKSRPEHSTRMSGSGNSNWRGGHNLSKGYVRIYKKGHPKAFRNYVYEHILIAEKALGRYLKPKERVHHINEIKNDNRNENLLICTHAFHKWLHARMKANLR